MKVILASRSPERARILEDLGFNFDVISADIDESPLTGESVQEIVLRLALCKAQHIHTLHQASVIAADTLIELEGEALGQPKDLSEAKQMLERYKSNFPRVWTSTVWISKKGEVHSNVEKADIILNELNETEWSQFWDKELWKKRAGAFSIFDKPCPLKISQGNLEVVRGINSKWLKEQSKRI